MSLHSRDALGGAAQYIAGRYSEMFGASPKQARKTNVVFLELVRPDGYWPYPYTVEQTFHIYRWLVETGAPYSQGGYGVYDLLVGRGTFGSHNMLWNPVRSFAQLRAYIQRAVLGAPQSKQQVAWRKKFKVLPNGKVVDLWFPHWRPFRGTPVLGATLSEFQLQAVLEKLWGTKGKLRVQLNEYHARAKNVVDIGVHCGNGKFCFDLEYGYDGSVWHHTLGEAEGFVDALCATLTEFRRLTGRNLLKEVLKRR